MKSLIIVAAALSTVLSLAFAANSYAFTCQPNFTTGTCDPYPAPTCTVYVHNKCKQY